jgi:hypothetical protein
VVGGPATNDSSARPFSRPEEGEKIQWKGRKWEKSLHPLDAMAPLLSFFFVPFILLPIFPPHSCRFFFLFFFEIRPPPCAPTSPLFQFADKNSWTLTCCGGGEEGTGRKNRPPPVPRPPFRSTRAHAAAAVDPPDPIAVSFFQTQPPGPIDFFPSTSQRGQSKKIRAG